MAPYVSSSPSPLYDEPPRRGGRTANIVESPGFRLTQAVLTAIVLPVIAWGGTQMLDRLAKIDESIGKFATYAATNDMHLQTLDRDSTRLQADVRALQDKVSSIDYAQRRLDERTTAAQAQLQRSKP